MVDCPRVFDPHDWYWCLPGVFYPKYQYSRDKNRSEGYVLTVLMSDLNINFYLN
jgi:hypothetical protein